MTKHFIKRLFLSLMSIAIIITMVYFLLGLSNRVPSSKSQCLTKPIYMRFIFYIKSIFSGNGFGQIYSSDFGTQQSIVNLFFGPFRYSLLIAATAFIISILIGVTLGFWSGYKNGTWIDRFISFFIILFMAVPSFIFAAFGIMISKKMGLPITFVNPVTSGWSKTLTSLIIPTAAMTLSSLSLITYYTRNETVKVFQSNQVTIARSKGLKEWDVFKKYVLKNVSIPLVRLFLPSFIIILSGSIVIENFFGIPGSSTIITKAVKNAEYNIIMFIVLIFVSISLLISIIVDIISAIIDPKFIISQNSSFKFILILKGMNTRRINKKLANAKGGTNEK